MINVIIVCFTKASSNLTLQWSPVLPPLRDARNTGCGGGASSTMHFLGRKLRPCWWGVGEVVMTTPVSRTSPGHQDWGAFSQSGSMQLAQQREPGLQWRRLGAQVSAAIREARAAAALWSSQHTLSRHSAPPIVGEPGQQGERSHFAFLEQGLRNEPPKDSGKEKSERQIPASS